MKVVVAVIEQDGNFLVGQRNDGPYDGKWEFPGGKVEKNETYEEAIIREIREELSLEVQVKKHLFNLQYEYPEYLLELIFFSCSIMSGDIKNNVHKDVKWVKRDDLNKLDWLEANIGVLDELINFFE